MNSPTQIPIETAEIFSWIPDHLQKSVGQFNVFPLDVVDTKRINCQPYNRKGYYKISLLSGHTRLTYADKTLEFEKHALLFSNPNVPYAWDLLGTFEGGYFCVFSDDFFTQFGAIKDYPVFKTGQIPLFELDTEQMLSIQTIFKRMLNEIDSDFYYKYDALRTLVLELIYTALKMNPQTSNPLNDSNASIRITSLFTELLERQFPIELQNQGIKLRHPAEFAENLSIHVNYLNRVLKRITGKNTSQLISQRLMQEARSLLQHSNWNISEIAYSLGFDELPHFINFFKKLEGQTPNSFRKIIASTNEG